MSSTLSSQLAEISQAIKSSNFSLALSLYSQLHQVYPDYLDARHGSPNSARNTHIANAANLARRDGYLRWQFMESVSDRLKAALSHFVGLQRHPYQYADQQPNFFYIPGLPSQPFFEPEQVPGLAQFAADLQSSRDALRQLSVKATERYTDGFDVLPDTEQWQTLSEHWHSVHLIKAGVFTEAGQSMEDSLRNLFNNELIADCPPHAPEVFISVLQPGAYIPPHYGVSNCKLTVHVPLQTHPEASLTVAGETRSWCEKRKLLIFDDSFIHEAKNGAEHARSVLIMDIWNPHLTREERVAIAVFMKAYAVWNEQFGHLANLDKYINR